MAVGINKVMLMENIDLLIRKLLADLPKELENDTFYELITNCYTDFIGEIEKISEDELNTLLKLSSEITGNKTKLRLINLIKCIQNNCLRILQYAYMGDILNALKHLENLLMYQKYTQNKLKDYYVNYFRTETYNQDFYRCVDFNCDEKKENINCWHVPFNQREKASRNRFNQSGFPCFYLASSKSCANKEIGHEPMCGKKRWCGKYHQTKNLYYLDFSLPNIETMSSYDKFAFFITYPIRLMCLVKVNNKEKNFCEEYMFSQLFFHILFMHKNDKFPQIDGIKYISMFDREATCVVIPAKYETQIPPKDGYSSFVQSSFKEIGNLEEIYN